MAKKASAAVRELFADGDGPAPGTDCAGGTGGGDVGGRTSATTAEFLLPGAATALVMSVGSAVVTTVASDPASVGAGAAARIAAANSAALWKRSSGRLASALRTTASIPAGASTLRIDGGIGSSLSTFCIVVVAEPAKGRSPVRN